MNKIEYEQIKHLSYLEYCDYLQAKYGLSNYDYMTKSWNKNPKVTRTKEGLFAHHKYEDRAILLGEKAFAMQHPFEWQKKENLVYCDYLEHLLLHILICEYPHPDAIGAVGIGGAQNFIIPELNDFYSGYPLTQAWKLNCFNKVREDREVYIQLVNRLIANSSTYPCFNKNQIISSFNEQYGKWKASKNQELYKSFKW